MKFVANMKGTYCVFFTVRLVAIGIESGFSLGLLTYCRVVAKLTTPSLTATVLRSHIVGLLRQRISAGVHLRLIIAPFLQY